jgi:hypothetical protein
MTEDLFKQAEADFLRAKARKEQTAAAVLRSHTEDDEAQLELDRMRHVLDWMEPLRPQMQDEPQARTAAPTAVPPRRAPRKPARPRKKKNLSDLVEDAVRQIRGSVSNTDILEQLHQDGYNFTPLQVRGSAKHLAQKGRLVSGGYGLWALPEDAPQSEDAPPHSSPQSDDPQLDFASAVPVAEAATASVNGHVPAGTD